MVKLFRGGRFQASVPLAVLVGGMTLYLDMDGYTTDPLLTSALHLGHGLGPDKNSLIISIISERKC